MIFVIYLKIQNISSKLVRNDMLLTVGVVVKNLTNFLYYVVYYMLQLYLMSFSAVDVNIIVNRNVKNTICRVKVSERMFEPKHVCTKHCIGGRSNTSLSH